jgi:serine/threonine-protein kinase
LAVQEAATLLRLRHPRLLRAYDGWVEAGPGAWSNALCMATEYCDGGTLEDILEAHAQRNLGGLPPADAVALGEQLAEGLAALHAMHMLHRDIKPGNIFLRRGRIHTTENARGSPVRSAHQIGGGGTPGAPFTAAAAANTPSRSWDLVLGDLGIARQLEHTNALASTRVGTPLYFSPEVVAGSCYDAKSDVWAAGVVLYELVTGDRPFRAPHEAALMASIMHADPVPELRRVGASRGYPPRVLDAIAACLDKCPQNRPTAADLQRQFKTAAATLAQAVVGAAAAAAVGPVGGPINATPQAVVVSAAAAAAAAGGGGGGGSPIPYPHMAPPVAAVAPPPVAVAFIPAPAAAVPPAGALAPSSQKIGHDVPPPPAPVIAVGVPGAKDGRSGSPVAAGMRPNAVVPNAATAEPPARLRALLAVLAEHHGQMESLLWGAAAASPTSAADAARLRQITGVEGAAPLFALLLAGAQSGALDAQAAAALAPGPAAPGAVGAAADGGAAAALKPPVGSSRLRRTALRQWAAEAAQRDDPTWRRPPQFALEALAEWRVRLALAAVAPTESAARRLMSSSSSASALTAEAAQLALRVIWPSNA